MIQNQSSNDEDTDSLEIKPPQMISRYDKHKKSSSSSSRDKKHSRGEHRHKDRTRERSERHSRQHHNTQASGRHHTGLDPYEKYHPSSRDSSHQKRFVQQTLFFNDRSLINNFTLFLYTDVSDTAKRKRMANVKWKIYVVDC